MRPYIVVTGLPGSGKSTVGAAISEALSLPLLDKDDILEALFESLGVGDQEWRARMSRAADRVMQSTASRSRGGVLVAWWQHPGSSIPSGTTIDWLRSLHGEIVEVYCRCTPQTAVNRFFARARHPGHLDSQKSRHEELARFEEFAACGPLRLGQVLDFDAEAGESHDELVRQLGQLLSPSSTFETPTSPNQALQPTPQSRHG